MHEDAISLRFCWVSGRRVGTLADAGRVRPVFVQRARSQEVHHGGPRSHKGSRWLEAARKYEAAVTGDPSLRGAHFFLANSYDNLYKPSRAGEAENDEYMKKAIEWYKKAAEKEPDLIYRQRAMQYLVAAYGPEKLNNPAEAEPLVKRMMELDPSEYLNYLELAKISRMPAGTTRPRRPCSRRGK